MKSHTARGRRRARRGITLRRPVSRFRMPIRDQWAGRPGRLAGSRSRLAGRVSEAGAATAEYAMTIMAGAAFAAVLIKIINGGTVSRLLTGIVTRALT